MAARRIDALDNTIWPPELRAVLFSLKAFLAAALRPQTPLARAIVTVLSIKLMAVAAMAFYFHSSSQRVAADTTAISRLLGPTAPP